MRKKSSGDRRRKSRKGSSAFDLAAAISRAGLRFPWSRWAPNRIRTPNFCANSLPKGADAFI
jgi:hypothetical protein